MNWIRLSLALPLAALLMCWAVEARLWAQDSTPGQPDTSFQPADSDEYNPDTPPSTEAQAESPGGAEPEGAQQTAADKPGEADPAAGQDTQPEAPEPAEEIAQPEPAADSAFQDRADSGSNEQESGPLSDSELSSVYEPHPTSVRVVVLNTSGRSRGAGLIAFLLEEYRKNYLETKIGKLISVVNQSSVTGEKLKKSIIFYRPGHLRAALIMADAIPGKQAVRPMRADSTRKSGVDVEIRVGMELP